MLKIMALVNLPIERAVEPDEEACEGVRVESFCNEKINKTDAHITEYTPLSKNALSQPPKCITHKEKLLWLQHRRKEGLWAQCNDCNRWRYLPRVLDSYELPSKWYCWMNPDPSLATCLAPEVPICLYDEDDLIYAEYAAGSVVLARMPGYPWWPAMVCDCPDTEQYYWLDGFSDIPTHYNVVFFDAHDVSRAWMAPEQLLPYKNNTQLLKKSIRIKKYKDRINTAANQANDAETLPLAARLAKYSFIARFNGKILTPKKIKKREKTRYINMLKRKFNIIGFSDESSEEEEDNEVEKSKIKKQKNKKDVKKFATINNPICTDTDAGVLSKTTMDSYSNKTMLSSLSVQIDSNSGLINDVEVTNTEKKHVNSIDDSNTQENFHTQDATCNNIEEDSDNFDF